MKSQQISLGSSSQAIVIRENTFDEFGLESSSKTGILNVQAEKAEQALEHVAKHAWKIMPARNGQQFGEVKKLRALTEEEQAFTKPTMGSRGNPGFNITFDETLEVDADVVEEEEVRQPARA